jgi:hypothetical protein
MLSLATPSRHYAPSFVLVDQEDVHAPEEVGRMVQLSFTHVR